jgi:hypothetical protein
MQGEILEFGIIKFDVSLKRCHASEVFALTATNLASSRPSRAEQYPLHYILTALVSVRNTTSNISGHLLQFRNRRSLPFQM